VNSLFFSPNFPPFSGGFDNFRFFCLFRLFEVPLLHRSVLLTLRVPAFFPIYFHLWINSMFCLS
jgi:hypothetical protein